QPGGSGASRRRLDGGGDTGLFATMFHGCLDPSSGTLRYVDAGHGYCVIVRHGGELEQLPERSMPVGVLPNQEFKEGGLRLEPGDTRSEEHTSELQSPCNL